MLRMNPDWRFETPGPIAVGVADAFSTFITRVAAQGDDWTILERFKGYFASAAGVPHHVSSSASWAATDLDRIMGLAGANAALFIDAFWTACQSVKEDYPDVAVPDVARINRVLVENNAGYEIRDDEHLPTRAPQHISVPMRPPSFDQEAQRLIESSLVGADNALNEGKGRQAVQELLWLLETVVTAFRGTLTADGSVQARYFIKIIGELRASQRGNHQEQIFNWIINLYGFLSSPTGGGIRHGRDLVDGDPLQIKEARLYCNLIRSYMTYLITEHERLRG